MTPGIMLTLMVVGSVLYLGYELAVDQKLL